MGIRSGYGRGVGMVLAVALLAAGVTSGLVSAPSPASAAVVGLPLPTTLTLGSDETATAPVPIPASVRGDDGVVRLAPQISATVVSLPSGCDQVSLQLEVADTQWGHLGFNAMSDGQTQTIRPAFPSDGTTTRKPVIQLWETWTAPCAGAQIRITLWSGTCPRPTLSVQPGSTGVKVGQRVTVQGCGFSKSGGPITLSWESERLTRLPARGSFTYSFAVAFPDAATSRSCAGVLTASQSGRSHRQVIKGTPKVYAFVARGVTRPGGARVRDGEMLCDGDTTVRLAGQHVWVTTDQPVAARSLSIDSVVGSSRVSAATVMLGLRGGISLRVPGGRVTVRPVPGVGPVRRDATGFDPTQDCRSPGAGCVTLPATVSATMSPYDTMYVAPQPLRIDGDVRMEQAIIYADGPVTVDGSLAGRGWVAANGRLTVTGDVLLEDEADAWRSALIGQDGIVLP